MTLGHVLCSIYLSALFAFLVQNRTYRFLSEFIYKKDFLLRPVYDSNLSDWYLDSMATILSLRPSPQSRGFHIRSLYCNATLHRSVFLQRVIGLVSGFLSFSPKDEPRLLDFSPSLVSQVGEPTL